MDPGVEDEITETANEMDGEKAEEEARQREEDDFLQPSRWWFASTACPLLAGTLGPVATGFNICALVEFWRESIPPLGIESEGTPIKDPSWLIAINALSLVSAVIGNASLLLNMAHRIKFSIAQPITISGFLLAGVLLIADLATITSLPHYGIATHKFQPGARHALTSAFYYGIWAAAIYTIIGCLMCVTVYGAIKDKFTKDFHLTTSQRTLMLQTMSFMMYLLLGAAVYCNIEGWDFLDALYWADVTLLTIGLGDFSPSTSVGQGLLFPFAIGGILILGLVIGSIRSLVLERGKEKMSARIVEKRRADAVHNVDDRKQTIRISVFAKADFNVDPDMSPAQRREEEFNVMRKVQDTADSERRWFSLATSAGFALVLWFVGAAVFMHTEYLNHWTYLESLYFAYTSLLTIGYGDFHPKSNSGKAFFVLWSLLAIPSLTILISNMGDTIVKWVSDLTNWIGSVTVLPGEGGMRVTFRKEVSRVLIQIRKSFENFSGPGVFGIEPREPEKPEERTEYENKMLDRLAERLTKHVDKDERTQYQKQAPGDDQYNDTQFYHYVLAREARNLQKDLSAKPPKKYRWAEWEYYLKLMGDEKDPVDYPGQKHPDILVPDALLAPDGLRDDKKESAFKIPGSKDGTANEEQEPEEHSTSSEDRSPSPVDGNVDRQTSKLQGLEAKRKMHPRMRRRKNPEAEPDYLRDWSWLSNESPLMSTSSEAQWILDRISAALERELNRQRKGYKTKPPITLHDAMRSISKSEQEKQKTTADDEAGVEAERRLEHAAKGER